MERLQKQVSFIVEIDRLKNIVRKSYVTDGSRCENDAEHSWYFALIAAILAEHAGGEIDVNRVMRMALIHDIVEIDAGDVIMYDEAARRNQAEKEEHAARRIFGLLPEDQALELESLWREFEKGETADAKYARAIDRFSAIVLNYATKGKAWREHNIAMSQVKRLNREIIERASPHLWELVEKMIDETFKSI